MSEEDEEELRLARVVADDPGEEDEQLDLRGQTLIEALVAVDHAIGVGTGGRSLRLLIDPPTGDGRATLFAPIARHLLLRRREKTLSRLIVLDQGAGFWIRVR